MHLHQCNMSQHRKKHSATGTRTRVARVRAEYPNQLDYSGYGGPTPGARAWLINRPTLWKHAAPCNT